MRRRSVVVPLTTKPTLRNFVCVYTESELAHIDRIFVKKNSFDKAEKYPPYQCKKASSDSIHTNGIP